MTSRNKLSFVNATLRGFAGRCPNCGTGKLFRAFLKPVDRCANCGEIFGHIRADDGPAWLTILIVGHLIVPALFMVEQRTSWPEWVAMTFWPALALVLVLMLLPRSKGAFIAAIWQTGSAGSEIS
ncbi:MAG: DUF983 domain-containing protein [Alphaproteobacteria bacterium]|nr:DUF983 domain-containing protein [Alphaproteobacteria bacterium]